VKTAAVKTGKQAKVTAKSRGEDALKIDIVANPPGPGGLVTVLTIRTPATASPTARARTSRMGRRR
jgi:hypothetical protein